MLCRVEQEAKHVRRQLCSTDTPMIEESIAIRLAELPERALNRPACFVDEIGQSGGRIPGC